jgi:hypothetical protein
LSKAKQHFRPAAPNCGRARARLAASPFTPRRWSAASSRVCCGERYRRLSHNHHPYSLQQNANTSWRRTL